MLTTHSGPLLVAVALTCSVASSQVRWTQRTILERTIAPIAFDVARNRLVMFGSPNGNAVAQTWEFDGTVWARRHPTSSPSARTGRDLVYDAARQRVVLLGGDGLTETWEWDGNDWTRRTPAQSPPPRSGFALAYDTTRSRVLLFGGENRFGKVTTYLDDTWEWDGNTWTQLLGIRPPPRAAHRLVHDSARGRTVLFGGTDSRFLFGGGPRNDTWEFDGNSWTQIFSPTTPPPRATFGMAYDAARGRTLVFGGAGNAPGPLGDMWSWNGVDWVAESSGGVQPRFAPSMAFDSVNNRTMLFSGRDANHEFGDLWQWTGVWSSVQDAPAPIARHSAAVAFDDVRGRLVVFSGYANATISDTWELAGDTWVELRPATHPTPRGRAAMAFDPMRRRMVLFGGELPGPSGETWEWDGLNWTRVITANAPPARFDHAMAYDAARGVMVMFGGVAGGVVGDTWTFDGSNWTNPTTAVSPTARLGHAMAFDAARREVVLFGGSNPFGLPTAETWVWDGSTWTQRNPSQSPPPRIDHEMTYDPARQRVVMFGGGWGVNRDTWDWDGTTWAARNVATAPAARARHGLAYDSVRQSVVLYGGQTDFGTISDVWDLEPVTSATTTRFGAACAGSAGAPTLDATTLPWLGDRVTLAVAPIPDGAPTLAWLGLSRTSWQGFSLPVDLTIIGLTGCQLHVGSELAFGMTTTGRSASAVISLPSTISLLGFDLYAQSLVYDATANPLGAVTSNALGMRLGGR